MNNTYTHTKTVAEKIAESRILLLSGTIDTDLANYIIMNLLMLDAESHDDIYLYINSPGGSVADGLAIIDTMNHIKSNVVTIAIGTAASMAAVILSAGAKGKRKSLPNASILLHQVMGGVQGQATEIEITYRHINDLKQKLNRILANNTKQKIGKIEEDTDRDFWLDAEGALDYGIVDSIITN